MKTFEWHNNPSFKNFFESEISILKRGLKGDFNLHKLIVPKNIGERVEAFGELNYGKNKKQKIKIIFPPKYPYTQPNVFACNYEMDNSGNIIGNVSIVNFWKGNQYNNGKLCLLDQEDWNKDKYNIGWVLRRTQKWLLSVNSEKGFTKDLIVDEYPSIAQYIGQVLIPKDIKVPLNANRGTIELTQFKPNYYIFEQQSLSDQSFNLNANKEKFKWFKFEKNVTLKSLFPKFNSQIIINILKDYFGYNPFEGSPNLNIAFYLPGEESKWHFFKIIFVKNGGLLSFASMPHYYISRNINKELYLRTKDIFDDKILNKKRVTIIGLGAIGSEVAKSLAKNGVGHFNLFDMDTFEIGNSIRHAADLYYVGENKVNVVKKLIYRSNPNITVNPYHINILDDCGLLEKSLKESDICIVLTAEDSVEYLINDFYQQNFTIPFIFARASTGAFSGGIQIVDSESACLRCLSLYSADTLPKPNNLIRFDQLKPEYASCSSPALPGSEIDTKEIAIQVARITIQYLLNDENSSYAKLLNKQYYWHGPYGSDTKEPFTWEMKNIKKHKKCPICH